MTDVAKQPGLILRAGIYYYRKVVPKDVVHVLGTELRVSLGTRDFEEAKKRRNLAAVESDRKIRNARAQLAGSPSKRRSAPFSEQEIRSRIIRYVTEERTRSLTSLADDSDPGGHWREERLHEAARLSDDYLEPNSTQARQDIARLRETLFSGQIENQDTETQAATDSLLLQALLEIEQSQIQWLRGRINPEAQNPAFRTKPERIRTLAQVTTSYLDDYSKFKTSVGPKRPQKLAADIALINEFFGEEILITEVSRQQCRNFRDFIADLPSNMTKKYPDRTLTLAQVVKDAKAKKLKTLAYNSQAGYIQTLKMLFSWVQEEHIRSDNPAMKLKPIGIKPAAKEARLPFQSCHLTSIFSAPLFTGCMNDRDGYAKRGDYRILGTRAWVMLISCFSGARLNEICQLRIEDFKSVGNQHFISINNEFDRRIKNSASKRLIPIHPELIRLGIHNLALRSEKYNSPELFFDLPLSKRGYKSENYSRWFNERFFDKVNKDGDKLLTFHSFRHMFKDVMLDAGLSVDIRSRICGWNEEASAGRNYGTGISPTILHDAMSSLRIRDLDLSHLQPLTSE